MAVSSKDIEKVVKIIRHEHNECQMYYQKFDKNLFNLMEISHPSKHWG